jgi:hypothetical protein
MRIRVLRQIDNVRHFSRADDVALPTPLATSLCGTGLRMRSRRRGGAMSWEALLPSLMFMTIGLVLVFAIVQFAMFLRRRRNRDAARNAFRGDEHSALARKAERTTAPPEQPPRR